MTEAKFTKRLITEIKKEMPGAVVFKHADKFTVGVPDMSVSWGGVTTWWEIKVFKNAGDKTIEQLMVKSNKLWMRQALVLSSLYMATEGLAGYIVLFPGLGIRTLSVDQVLNDNDEPAWEALYESTARFGFKHESKNTAECARAAALQIKHRRPA